MLTGVKAEHINIPYSFDSTLFRRINYKLSRFYMVFDERLGYYTELKKVKNIKQGDVLVAWDVNDVSFLRLLRKQIPDGVALYFWQWNLLDKTYPNNAEDKVNEIKSLDFTILTFDKKDAIKYDIEYRDQFYYCKSEDIIIDEWDFYFAGLKKNRGEIISSIKNKLSGYRVRFDVVLQPEDCFSYEEYLNRVRKSKCIIDIPQAEQDGLTLRPLEALFLKKKLITTNVNIRNYDFYNPCNIFIWEIDSFQKLHEFILSPYCDVSESIIQKYEINTWAREFVHSNNN